MLKTLPVKPKKLGEISRVLTSALASLAGDPNSLQLQPKRMVCVILVDGLGYHNLQRRSGHAPVLTSLPTTKSYTVFPSTTAAALTSLATGLSPGQHGMVGHVAHDRQLGVTKNLLSGWNDVAEAELWKNPPDLSQLFDGNIKIFNVSASEYQSTGFTAITMSKSRFVPADSMRDRFRTAAQLLRDSQNRGAVYLYIQELDQAGHRHGWQSSQWTKLLEQLDALVEQLILQLPSDCGILITADHGQIDSPLSQRHELKADLPHQLRSFAGDSRAAYLYLHQPDSAEDIHSLIATSGLPAQTFLTSQIIEAGWFGDSISETATNRLPDLVMLATGENTLFHSDFSKPRSYLMTGHHGGLTDQELAIPLIRVGF